MKPVYKVIFHNQGRIYELHASSVSQGEIYTFVEIEGIIFDEILNWWWTRLKRG